jgi:hypothetical protein
LVDEFRDQRHAPSFFGCADHFGEFRDSAHIRGHVTVCNLSIKGNGGRSAIDLPEHGAAIFRAGAWVIFSIVCEPGLACGVTAVMTCILSGF